MSCVLFLGVSLRRCQGERLGIKKGNLSNNPMKNHLKGFHPKENSQFLIKKQEKDGVVGEKRKTMDQDEEMESGTVQLYNIRTIKQRNDFLV